MIGQQQYYQAKVFLSNYRDALSTLDQAAKNRALVDKYHAFEKYLVGGSKNGEIIVEGGYVKQGTYFNESRIRKLGIFSKSLFSDQLRTFDSARTYQEVKTSLESYL